MFYLHLQYYIPNHKFNVTRKQIIIYISVHYLGKVWIGESLWMPIVIGLHDGWWMMQGHQH